MTDHRQRVFCLIAATLASVCSTSLHAENRLFVTSERMTLGTETFRSASVRMGDIDGDGDLDIVAANGRHWPQRNELFVNQGRAKFSVLRPLGTDMRPTYACEFADLDNDGDLDIATGNDMAKGQIFLNDGAGNLAEHSEFGDVSSLRSLMTLDIDRDGDIDLIATCRGRPNRVYLNDAHANFREGPSFGTDNDSTIDVAAGDVNNDGHVDLLLANRDRQPNEILLGNNSLTFAQRIPFGSGQDQSRSIAVADLNNDGNLDWVVGNIGQTNLIYLGDGMGGVSQTQSLGNAEDQTYALAIADMDNDGLLDIIVGNVDAPGSVSFQRGKDPTSDILVFDDVPFGDSFATYGLCVGDLDNDGFADIAVANSGSMNRFFLNRPAKK